MNGEIMQVGLVAAGVVLAAIGLWLIYPPLAFLAGGMILVAAGLVVDL